MQLISSRNIIDFTSVIEWLKPDFGDLSKSIYLWCHPEKLQQDTRFWKVWLIQKDNIIIGICGLYSLDYTNDVLWLGWFGLIPSFRSTGIGSQVLQELKVLAIENGAKKLNSYVDRENHQALKFYQRAGFERISSVKEYCKKYKINKNEFGDPEDDIITLWLQDSK